MNVDPEGGEADVSETRLEHRPRRVAHVLLAARVCVRACLFARVLCVVFLYVSVLVLVPMFVFVCICVSVCLCVCV